MRWFDYFRRFRLHWSEINLLKFIIIIRVFWSLCRFLVRWRAYLYWWYILFRLNTSMRIYYWNWIRLNWFFSIITFIDAAAYLRSLFFRSKNLISFDCLILLGWYSWRRFLNYLSFTTILGVNWQPKRSTYRSLWIWYWRSLWDV